MIRSGRASLVVLSTDLEPATVSEILALEPSDIEPLEPSDIEHRGSALRAGRVRAARLVT